MRIKLKEQSSKNPVYQHLSLKSKHLPNRNMSNQIQQKQPTLLSQILKERIHKKKQQIIHSYIIFPQSLEVI